MNLIPLYYSMKKHFIVFLFGIVQTMYSQHKMKSADELIDTTQSAWPLVIEWINSAKNKVEVLQVDAVKAKEALYQTQVTTRSPMGAIIYNTGGILVDDGWIRILGSGNKKLNRSLPEWNKTRSFENYGETPGFLLVADDAIGGFFILNGGKFGKDLGKIYYFSPDALEYESLDITYTEFILFCFNNNLEQFYSNNRWKNWREEVSKLDGNKVFNFYPYLWSKEAKDINQVSRKIIDIGEQYYFNIETRDKQNSKRQ